MSGSLFDDSDHGRYNPRAFLRMKSSLVVVVPCSHKQLQLWQFHNLLSGSKPKVNLPQEDFVDNYLYIGLIITSIALIFSVILQSKGAGLGGLTGADMGGVFTARRGIERTLFYITIVLSVMFFLLCIATVIITG